MEEEEEEIYVYVLGWVRVDGMYVSRVRHIPPPLACLLAIARRFARCRVVSRLLDLGPS